MTELLVRPVREEDAEAAVAIVNAVVRAGRSSSMPEETTVADQIAFYRGRGFEPSGEPVGSTVVRGRRVERALLVLDLGAGT